LIQFLAEKLLFSNSLSLTRDLGKKNQVIHKESRTFSRKQKLLAIFVYEGEKEKGQSPFSRKQKLQAIFVYEDEKEKEQSPFSPMVNSRTK